MGVAGPRSLVMEELRVCFVGAGSVNFGDVYDPWDHSRRLERLGGVRFVAIVDPILDKARDVLEQKRSGPFAAMYADCQLFADIATALQQRHFDVAFIGELLRCKTTRPTVLIQVPLMLVHTIVGVPPSCHGSFSRDLELQLLKAGVHLFVEKPVSVIPPEEFAPYAEAVERERQSRGLVVSVGYMFRYHPAVLQMREELTKHGRPVIALSARYNCAYAHSTHPLWWDMRHSGGPIIEQATHFCDLVRFLTSGVDLDTVQAFQVPPSDCLAEPGNLTSIHSVVQEASKKVPIKFQVDPFTAYST